LLHDAAAAFWRQRGNTAAAGRERTKAIEKRQAAKVMRDLAATTGRDSTSA
jgi:hypothetical protein